MFTFYLHMGAMIIFYGLDQFSFTNFNLFAHYGGISSNSPENFTLRNILTVTGFHLRILKIQSVYILNKIQ